LNENCSEMMRSMKMLGKQCGPHLVLPKLARDRLSALLETHTMGLCKAQTFASEEMTSSVKS
jgi:hypothetical protein